MKSFIAAILVIASVSFVKCGLSNVEFIITDIGGKQGVAMCG
jgi:hypothetical protein